jgi:putative spermidine/putrescine transport system substrate-binding protein
MKKRTLCYLVLAVILSFSFLSSAGAASKSVTIVTYGGAWGELIKQVFLDPFEKETGIKVNHQFMPKMSKIKAMVDTGNVEWDLVEGGDSVRIPLEKGGYLEKIDYSYFDKETLSGYADYQKMPYGIYFMGYSTVIAYSLDAFPNGGPKSWADVWDVEKFPGPRCLHGGGGGYGMIEEALLVDGVPKDKLYPCDMERAFKQFDKIRPHVVKWWRSGAVAPQLLVDNEVVIANAYSGRIAKIKEQGANVAMEYNEGNLSFEMFVVPKGTKNYDAAMKLLAFIAKAENQAAMSNNYPNGAVNKHAYKFISAEKAKDLPTSPENMKKQFVRDGEYWGKIDPATNKSRQELSAQMWQEWAMK